MEPSVVSECFLSIEAALQACSGIEAQPHRFGGREYRLGRREIGHVHGDQLVDIPFPKNIRDELVSSGPAEPHHILPQSGWVSIHLNDTHDVERAIELLKLSFEMATKRPEESCDKQMGGSVTRHTEPLQSVKKIGN